MNGWWLLMAGEDWRAEVLAAAWSALKDCPPRDAAPLLRIIKDVHEGAPEAAAVSKLDQLEKRRQRRGGKAAG